MITKRSFLKYPCIHLFWVFFKLGCTSFGGPLAHIAFFQHKFVHEKKWFSEATYGELVSLSHLLPGASSSQVGMAIGYLKGGYLGAFCAWLGFTLPTASVLILIALAVGSDVILIPPSVIHILKIMTAAIVAKALYEMASKMCRTYFTIGMMLLGVALNLIFPYLFFQLLTIIIALTIGVIHHKMVIYPPNSIHCEPQLTMHKQVQSMRSGYVHLGICGLALVFLYVLAQWFDTPLMSIVNQFYWIGSFVFGGGHSVLPLLHSFFVTNAWLTNDTFLAGYAMTQAMPGPLFSFAAFIGASLETPYPPIGMAVVSLVIFFLPSYLFMMGAMPFWASLRDSRVVRSVLLSVNAVVVGILLATFYRDIWQVAILDPKDFVLALVGYVTLVYWKLSPALVVILPMALTWGGVILLS